MLHLAHSTSHQAMRKTPDRIRISGLTWDTLAADCRRYCSSCKDCQLRARITCFDRVPISPIERAQEPFQHWFMDCAGKLLPDANIEYNYCLILVCSYSRFPAAYPLRSLTAKNVCDKLLELFSMTGLSSNVTVLTSDNATNFCAALNRELMHRLGVRLRFSTPGHP